MDLDVLSVQEVEVIDTLRQFASDDLGGLYPHVVLVEDNDRSRLIDIGLLSKLPLGAITSWQQVPDPLNLSQPIFSRDLLQVEILSADRSKRLFTVFNNHLKSHFVPFNNPNPTAEEKDSNERRQCAATAKIIAAQMRPDSRFVVTGDMNDGPETPYLAPLADNPQLKLTLGLTGAEETKPVNCDPPPPTTAWTERYKPSGKPAEYTLMDQVWLSPALASKKSGAFIGRRSKLGGDGSDHDPSWVTLEL